MKKKIIFFFVFLILATLDAFENRLGISIDYQTIIMLTIGATPMLISYVSNLEISTSGIKISRTEQEQIEKKLEIEGKKIKRKIIGNHDYVHKLLDTKSYLDIKDRNYALIKARIDIENRLIRIATINHCDECISQDFIKNLEIIEQKDFISLDIKNVILQIYPLLTERTIKYTAKHVWALEVSEKIVNTLNMLIELSLEEVK